jgi:hypothetical protein
MPGLNYLKYTIFYTVLATVLLTTPYTGGKLFAETKTGALRIIYGGGLMGKIEPCG